MLLTVQKSFLSTGNLTLSVASWYQLPYQRALASGIEMAVAITGEDLRCIDVWSIVNCGNSSTALCFRAFRNKSTGVGGNKGCEDVYQASPVQLNPTFIFLLPLLHQILCILSLSLLNPLPVYHEAFDAPVECAKQICERLDGLLTTLWASSWKQSSL